MILLVGPSGVGKTEAARVVAGHLFGSAWGMIRVDVSELTDADGVARLVGAAAPGRHQLEDEGLLTSAIRAKPHALLLLDEIEKAHPRVLDVFLQILEQGRLADAAGRTTDARRLVVVMTSCLRRGYAAAAVPARVARPRRRDRHVPRARRGGRRDGGRPARSARSCPRWSGATA